MFYDNYLKICEAKGISPTRVLRDLSISKSSYSHWKSGGEPLNETKKKIADYFDITVSELVSGEIEEAPAKEAEADEMAELLETIRRRPDLKILFSLSAKATPEDVKDTIKIIKALSGDDDGTDNY